MRLKSSLDRNPSYSQTAMNIDDLFARTKFAFSVAGPVVWNSLPAAVREADSLMYSFKRKLKTHLLILDVLTTD